MIAINPDGKLEPWSAWSTSRRDKIYRPADLDSARSDSDILHAWRLVYQVYFNAGLIPQNPFEIHTTPATVIGNTAVFLKKFRDQVQCTITAVIDSRNGIPLDSIYHKEINKLRAQGRLVMEVGLLAHCNQLPTASPHEYPYRSRPRSSQELAAMERQQGRMLMRLMRPTYWHGIHNNVTDSLIGVHPKHARSYHRAWGFEPCGPEKSYAAVNNRPVVLLRLNHTKVARQHQLPYAFDYALSNPLPPTHHQNSKQILDDTVMQYLRLRYPGAVIAA